MLQECGKSRSRLLLPFVVLALETGARYNTIRDMQWRNIDFGNRCLKFGKEKTPSGTGRTVPLNPRAVETLKFWAPPSLTGNRSTCFPLEKVPRRRERIKVRIYWPGMYSTDPIRSLSEISRRRGEARRNEPSAIARIARRVPWPTSPRLSRVISVLNATMSFKSFRLALSGFASTTCGTAP